MNLFLDKELKFVLLKCLNSCEGGGKRQGAEIKDLLAQVPKISSPYPVTDNFFQIIIAFLMQVSAIHVEPKKKKVTKNGL